MKYSKNLKLFFVSIFTAFILTVTITQQKSWAPVSIGVVDRAGQRLQQVGPNTYVDVRGNVEVVVTGAIPGTLTLNCRDIRTSANITCPNYRIEITDKPIKPRLQESSLYPAPQTLPRTIPETVPQTPTEIKSETEPETLPTPTEIKSETVPEIAPETLEFEDEVF